MPIIQQTTEIKITPENFLLACSPAELFTIDILIKQDRFRRRIYNLNDVPSRADIMQPSEPQHVFMCIICHKVPVDYDNGIDVCINCISHD